MGHSLQASPLARFVDSTTGYLGQSKEPVLLTVNQDPAPYSNFIQINAYDSSNHPIVGATVRLMLYDPESNTASSAPVLDVLFGATGGTTDATGVWQTDIKYAASHGVTVIGQVLNSTTGTWENTDTYKIIIVSAPPIVTNGTSSGGVRVYYSSATGDRHTPDVPDTTPLQYAQRIADAAETGRVAYASWGFPTLFYRDNNKQRVLIFFLGDLPDGQGSAGLTQPYAVPGSPSTSQDGLILLDSKMSQGLWPHGIWPTGGVSAGGTLGSLFMDGTSAHEMFHVCQLKCVGGAWDRWFLEACAEWGASKSLPAYDWYLAKVNASDQYFDILQQNQKVALNYDLTLRSGVLIKWLWPHGHSRCSVA